MFDIGFSELLILAVVASPIALAAKLKKQNLTQLISSSESIVAGTVVNVADADCAALINSLNATIDRYKSNARRARGGKPREDASPETPGETATDTPAQD